MPKKKQDKSMIIEKLPAIFLLFCLIAAMVAMLYILNPFITVIFVAAVLTIAFYPLYRKLSELFNGWNRIASFVTCFLIFVLLVVPVSLFILLLAGEAFSTYQTIQDQINSGVFDRFFQWEDGGFIYDLRERIAPVVDLDDLDIKENIVSTAQALSSYLVSQVGSVVKGLSDVLIGVVVMFFSMFYFFKDGEMIVQKIGRWSPLPWSYEKQLFTRIGDMVKAVVYGVFFTAVAQGFIGGIGFAITGVSNPVFWGTAMAFFSLVPVVGTAAIWFPAAVIMAILGMYWQAIFIAAWGIVVVGSVDNFLRPYLIEGKVKTYPLMTFLVVLGGVLTSGLKGVILGPVILILLVSFLHIYEAEYGKVLKD